MALSSVVDWRRAAGARSASRRYYERCQSARSCVDAVRECSGERNYVSWGRDNGVVREAGTVVFREFSRVLSRGLELEAVLLPSWLLLQNRIALAVESKPAS